MTAGYQTSVDADSNETVGTDSGCYHQHPRLGDETSAAKVSCFSLTRRHWNMRLQAEMVLCSTVHCGDNVVLCLFGQALKCFVFSVQV